MGSLVAIIDSAAAGDAADPRVAAALDATDSLAAFRDRFHIPKVDANASAGPEEAGNEECVYLVGNSLGAMPRAVRAATEHHLLAWENRGVEGHCAFERR